MKRLFLTFLLLMPVCAQAGFWTSALTTACITDLKDKFTKQSQTTAPPVLADKFERMCKCAANKTLSIVEPRSDNATAFDSVFSKALFTCIPEQ
jgi:hypothetical protein